MSNVIPETAMPTKGPRPWWARLRPRLANAVLLPSLSGDDAQELRKQVREDGALTTGYVLMSVLSAGIATLGLLQSSVAVVIGAMLVSPLMGPIAALGFAFSSLDGRRIREAMRVVAVGALIGIITGVLLTWLSPIRNATPEIIGRTQPTLLDLAIALFSGVAGGYATVRQRGGTAIGVAIATALMPPLAVIGYGLGVARWDFAGGATLLFLTNLAAISFSFAMIARLSGAARPFYRVERTTGYIVGGVAVFLALATPLALTLLRVAQEASARGETRAALIEQLKIEPKSIAQLDVSWPLRGEPVIDAVVIAPTFTANAEETIQSTLTKKLGIKPAFKVQQVVAADFGSQAKAMIDTAMERTVAGIAKDVPPFAAIRDAIGLPTQAIWVNRAERTVTVVPLTAPGWNLADYRLVEANADKAAEGWRVQVVPPLLPRLTLAVGDDANANVRALALWAMNRWNIRSVGMAVPPVSPRMSDEARAALQAEQDEIVASLKAAKIAVRLPIEEDRAVAAGTIDLLELPPSPTQVRAAMAARAAATAAAAAGTDAPATPLKVRKDTN